MSDTAFSCMIKIDTKRLFSVVKRTIFPKYQCKNADIYYNGKLVFQSMDAWRRKTEDI